MTGLSTHVLDAATGRPAVGLAVTLLDHRATTLTTGVTDDDGRIGDLVTEPLPPGVYRLVFDTETWFLANDVRGYYPEVSVAFRVEPDAAHQHVPLLLSPFSYTTYRGS